MDSSDQLADGVYYYLCTVTYIRLSGTAMEQLNGHVQILGSSAPAKLN